jgi:hypothetical protein
MPDCGRQEIFTAKTPMSLDLASLTALTGWQAHTAANFYLKQMISASAISNSDCRQRQALQTSEQRN